MRGMQSYAFVHLSMRWGSSAEIRLGRPELVGFGWKKSEVREGTSRDALPSLNHALVWSFRKRINVNAHIKKGETMARIAQVRCAQAC